jgi:hypothetical protein
MHSGPFGTPQYEVLPGTTNQELTDFIGANKLTLCDSGFSMARPTRPSRTFSAGSQISMSPLDPLLLPTARREPFPHRAGAVKSSNRIQQHLFRDYTLLAETRSGERAIIQRSEAQEKR